MTSPPKVAATTADNPGSPDRVGAPEEFGNIWNLIDELFPHVTADPTGQKALRKLQEGTGWFEPDARVELRIKSPSRGDIIINLDQQLTGYAAELIAQLAVKPLEKTRSGRGYNARTKKTTPAVNNANHSHRGGSTKNTPNERGIFNV